MTSHAPHRTIKLGKSGKVALVDAADYLRLSQFDWLLSRYAYRRYMQGGRPHTTSLQREVLRRPKAPVRFINGDPLDCRKENLRIFEGGEVAKRRGAKCPHCGSELYSPRRSPYLVRISVDGKRYRVGVWPSKRVADEIRRIVIEAARELRGRGLTERQIQRRLDLAAGREVRSRAS